MCFLTVGAVLFSLITVLGDNPVWAKAVVVTLFAIYAKMESK